MRIDKSQAAQKIGLGTSKEKKGKKENYEVDRQNHFKIIENEKQNL